MSLAKTNFEQSNKMPSSLGFIGEPLVNWLHGNFPLFDHGTFPPLWNANDRLVPPMNLRETEKSFFVELDLAGAKKKDLKVELVGDILTIHGEKKAVVEDTKSTYQRIESTFGSFSRSLKLPTNCDTKDLQCKYEDGVLRIEIPKGQHFVRPKKTIAID